jgi:hypothetical protein
MRPGMEGRLRKLGNASEIVFSVVFRFQPLFPSLHFKIPDKVENGEGKRVPSFLNGWQFGHWIQGLNCVHSQKSRYEHGKASFAGNGLLPSLVVSRGRQLARRPRRNACETERMRSVFVRYHPFSCPSRGPGPDSCESAMGECLRENLSEEPHPAAPELHTATPIHRQKSSEISPPPTDCGPRTPDKSQAKSRVALRKRNANLRQKSREISAADHFPGSVSGAQNVRKSSRKCHGPGAFIRGRRRENA